ncbi:MAG TPA: diguanylate cyclase, partial [Gemmataceae bacterium]
LVGDHVLTHVARCLERTVREGSDLVARWGGDEFAILLTPADERTAEAVAQRIEQELKTGFRLNASVVIRVVARVAVQVYDGQVDAQTVMRRVDDQLVRAKERRHVQASGDTGGDR